MSIPPFPSQDLAKLVLGYLAEEQLMTAYDEFLQASPYLDAHRNEYDRIFMTSLKNILAEYRAVKICVETCKPFALRRKMWQCTNLLDIVKFLITNVDINKIQLQEATEKSSLEKKNSTTITNTCEVCHSLKLANCVCKSKATDAQLSGSVSASHVEESSLQNSVEATPLADLPGNHVTTRKKHVKVLEKDSAVLSSNVSSLQSIDGKAKESISSHISPEEYLASCENSPGPKTRDNSSLNLDSTVKANDPSKSKHNIEEFDNVLKSVVSKNKTLSGSESTTSHRVSNASSFQTFASGVLSGDRPSATYNVPDSSTSENLNIRAPAIKDVYNDTIKGPPQLLLQVSNVNDNIEIQTCRAETPKSAKPRSKKSKKEPRSIEHKIQIISDVKVDKQYGESNTHKALANMPTVLQNATSTPLMPTTMQTITINGMPAFKHTPKTHTFTQDEIMAMPTLIVVPASSGSSQMQTSDHCEPIMSQTGVGMKMGSCPRILGPLIIDVPSSTDIPNKSIVTALPDLCDQKPAGAGLVKTVDVKNASVPKDNVVSLSNKESNTPQVLPLLRKSSSTPRRTSHVRVLDFATPRRILHENIAEQVPSSNPPVEIVLSGSTNILSSQTNPDNIVTKPDISVVVNEGLSTNDTGSSKENDAKNVINESVNEVEPKKKKDWDADLRALISNTHDPTTKRKPKKIPKKKTLTSKSTDSDKTDSNKKTRNKSPRVKRNRKKIVEEDDELPPNINLKSNVVVKPTINIINADYHSIEIHESRKDIESIKNKSLDKDEECIETPENERLSLQNMIGAKLNLSDLLETPYKQALYDIQMETPRFLDAGLPDEPLSDIKITNITTPLFLNTPKPAQVTPSSYSSRPTDYSSGGSYYRPDEKDYMPAPDLSTNTSCPVTSSKDDICIEKSPKHTETVEKKSRPRPVRQCTKNVSYYKSFAVAKSVDDHVDATSSCSENKSANSSFEFVEKKDNTITKTPRDKSQSLSKAETKKRSSTSRNRKSPKDSTVRDKPKSFMKIKPRYTPKKDTPARRNRKKTVKSPYRSPSLSQRQRTTSKEKSVNSTPLVVAMPTKSRRKSSTPRKLHCTKTFNSESSGHNSPEMASNIKPNSGREKILSNAIIDSDNEQLALRWSDDGSQDAKAKYTPTSNEIEDITKIKEFIDSSETNKVLKDAHVQDSLVTDDTIKGEGNFHHHLMKQGFDSQAAKNIEILLTDSPIEPPSLTRSASGRVLPISVEIVETKKGDLSMDKALEKDSSITNEMQVQDETDDDEVEFSVHDCHEGSKDYFVIEYDDTKETITRLPTIPLKDNYSMEICLEDVTVRLKATPFNLVLDQDPLCVEEIDYSYKETEQAVNSISNMERLYTPLKDCLKSQVYELFDSTLTSIDTPLKAKSPVKSPVRSPVRISETSVTELVKEKETEAKHKPEAKKRKRLQGSEESSSKRTKPDADLLLKTANIQNIDIETVLTKLHGH